MDTQFSSAPLGSQQRSSELYTAAQKLLKSSQTRAGVPTVDASKVGTTEPLQVPTVKNNRKQDNAMASIATTPPTQQKDEIISFGDLVSQSVSGIKDQEQKDMVMKLLNAADTTTSGKFSQAGEDVLSKLLGAQVNQSQRKKESARLQEQAGLPDLYAEQALIESNYDNSEAARNSRLVNEVGKASGVSANALNARQSEIQRQYGLQVADNRINELVVAGKINSANILIDKKLDLKYGDLEAEIDLYKSQLDAITPFMNKEQAQLAEKRQFLLTQATNEIQSARDSEKQLELTKATALKNAYDRGASPSQIAQIQDARSLADIASTGFTTSLEERLRNRNLQLQNEKIQNEISSTGKVDEKTVKSITSSKQQIDNALSASKEVTDKITKGEGFKGAVGAGLKKFLGAIPFAGRLVGGSGAAPGSQRAGFEATVNRLKSSLTLPALEQMRGLGAMSEVEFNTVVNSVAALNFDLSEKDFKSEVNRINTTLTLSKARNQALVDATNGLDTVPVVSPNGEAGVVPRSELEQALSEGYVTLE